MTNQVNQAFEDLLEQLYWEFDAERAKKSSGERDIFKGKLRFIAEKYKTPTEQNEQQEAVAEVRLDENNMKYIHWYKPWVHVLSSNSKLYLSPPKQAIPDGWRPIETVPKDGTQVIIKCSGGRVATAFYDDKQFFGEGWHVVVPFLGGFGSGTDTFIYFQEDMPTHWMPLPAQTTSLTSETNTEVGE